MNLAESIEEGGSGILDKWKREEPECDESKQALWTNGDDASIVVEQTLFYSEDCDRYCTWIFDNPNYGYGGEPHDVLSDVEDPAEEKEKLREKIEDFIEENLE